MCSKLLQYRQVRALLFYSHFEFKRKFILTVIYRPVYKRVKASVNEVVHHVWWMNFHSEEFSGRLLVVTKSSKQGLKEDKDLKFYLNYLDYIFILIEM